MRALHGKGVALLYDTLALLAESGYERARVDEYHHIDGTKVRHHYSGGEWTITITRPAPDGPTYETLRWSIHRADAMPTPVELADRIAGRVPAPTGGAR